MVTISMRDKKINRDRLRLLGTIVFIWLYIPHFFIYLFKWKKLQNNAKKTYMQIKLEFFELFFCKFGKFYLNSVE